MSLEQYPSASLHNVAALEPAHWTDDGDRLCRVPETVRAKVNEEAHDRLRHATGCEIRFVPTDPVEPIEVTLSAPARTRVHVFWGPFQPWEPTTVTPEPKTLSLTVPERIRRLTKTDTCDRFDPQVCRIRFERVPAVAVHAVTGDCRPPRPAELPDRRYLAYGTSITEGAAASAPHLNYVTHFARGRSYDALNLGCSGSAYCDPALGEYIAGREDWDVATLALSVNMANGGFSPHEFRERADRFVNTVAAAHPQKPIACLTLFPYFADATTDGDVEVAREYRSALRSIVTESPRSNLSLIEGSDLMSLPGLTADILHPGDVGMAAIGNELARAVENTFP